MTDTIDELLEHSAEHKAKEEAENSEVETQITEATIQDNELVVDTLNSGQERFHLQDIAENGFRDVLEDELGTYDPTTDLTHIQTAIDERYDGEWELEFLEFDDGSGGLGIEIAGEKIRVDTLVDSQSNAQVSHIVEQSEYSHGDIRDLVINKEFYADSLRSPDVSIRYTEEYTYDELLEEYKEKSIRKLHTPTALNEVSIGIYIILLYVTTTAIWHLLTELPIEGLNIIVFIPYVILLIYLLENNDNLIRRYNAYVDRGERVESEYLYSVPEDEELLDDGSSRE